MDLEIKVKRIHRLETQRALRAFADITVNDSLLIKGIKVIQGKTKLFVSMPQEQSKDKKWYDSVRCLTPEIREQISDEVLTAYSASN